MSEENARVVVKAPLALPVEDRERLVVHDALVECIAMADLVLKQAFLRPLRGLREKFRARPGAERAEIDQVRHPARGRIVDLERVADLAPMVHAADDEELAVGKL